MRRPIVWALLFVFIIAVPVAAQRVFVSTVVIGMSTRQANTYSFSSVPIPLNVKGLQIAMDLSEAPDPPTVLPAISASLDCSLDGGATWIAPGKDHGFLVDNSYGYGKAMELADGSLFISYIATGGHSTADAKQNAIRCIRVRIREDKSGIDLLPAPNH